MDFHDQNGPDEPDINSQGIDVANPEVGQVKNMIDAEESDMDYDTGDDTDDCHSIYECLSNDDSDFEYDPSLIVSDDEELETNPDYLTAEDEITSFSIERQNAREAKLKQTINQLRVKMSRQKKQQQKLLEKFNELKKLVGNLSPAECNALKKLKKTCPRR
jgi:predicted RNase H-like nuclease (RuvC/YqgF family)